MKKPRILYITPGVFDKGGISRYNRYQIQSLRELIGEENIRIHSLLGPDKDDFEEKMNVAWHGGGNNLRSRVGLVGSAFLALFTWRPDIIWVTHVNFSGMVWLFGKLIGAKTILNIYGQEV